MQGPEGLDKEWTVMVLGAGGWGGGEGRVGQLGFGRSQTKSLGWGRGQTRRS